MFKDTTARELHPYAPRDRLIAVVRCEGIELRARGSRSERHVMRTTVVVSRTRAPATELTLAAFAQGEPMMTVGHEYVIAAYRESDSDPWALVAASRTSAATATRDLARAEAELAGELGDEGNEELRAIEFASLDPKQLNDAIAAADPPSDVVFAVDPAPQVERLGAAGSPDAERPALVVIGRLRNSAATERSVRMFPVGRSGFAGRSDTPFVATLVDSKEFVDTSPALPPEPPMGIEITIPPRSEIVFRTAIDTRHLRYQGAPRVEIKWTLFFLEATWNPNGTLVSTLPARP